MPYLAGSFLVAKPILQDPSFVRTVVFILQHGEEGALGLVINRPASLKGLPFPVFMGGPCDSSGFLMLHGHPEWADPAEGTEPLAPGIYLGDASCLNRAGEDAGSGEKPGRYRMYKGYAGWGPEQLESELKAGAWTVTTASGELLFDTPSEEIWAILAPARIPEPSRN